MDATVKKNPKLPNDWTVTFKGITRGKIFAIETALESHGNNGSALALELLNALRNAMQAGGVES